MMNAAQGERLLGQLMLGASTRTACDDLHILYCDLLQALDDHPAFRYAYLSAMAQRDAVTAALEDVT